jgi:hypothetical protein
MASRENIFREKKRAGSKRWAASQTEIKVAARTPGK